MPHPNIILCMCDQLRAFEVGCYGNPVIRTPNIDRLAAEGVRFETAVTTFPVCMAARSVTLSGQYNRTCTGGVGNVATGQGEGRIYFPQYPFAGRPHLREATLPEILHGLGYHTAAIGKWHIHTWPHDIGFDQYVIPRVNHVAHRTVVQRERRAGVRAGRLQRGLRVRPRRGIPGATGDR